MVSSTDNSTSKDIHFYGSTNPYGCFSNFSRHGFELDGYYWKTSEHYFQAQKFVGRPDYLLVQAAETPMGAALLGRDKRRPLRPDWEQVKDDVMRKAVLAKFTRHAPIRVILLSTGDARLIEDSPTDYYWGCGKDGTGKNMLGIILMEVREQLGRSLRERLEELEESQLPEQEAHQ